MKSAVCVYVRNEQDNILEWIVYHFVVGFDTVIVMDNLSDDRTRAVAERCRPAYDVRIEEWPDKSPEAQKTCYNHVLATYGTEFDWIAFIDSDEFIVPVRDLSMPAFLATVAGHGAVGVNWAIFGSNGHQAMPTGLVIEDFTRRAEDSFGPNAHIKSIVRPAATLSCAHPHLFHLQDERWDPDGSYRSDYVDPSGHPVVWGVQPGLTAGTPDLSVCRIHHYFTRSQAHWDRKMQRRWRDVERPYDAFHFHDRNEVEDLAALRYLPELKARLDALP